MRHIPDSWEGRAGRGHELPGREAGPVQGAGGGSQGGCWNTDLNGVAGWEEGYQCFVGGI